jgi:hypothetical protein
MHSAADCPEHTSVAVGGTGGLMGAHLRLAAGLLPAEPRVRVGQQRPDAGRRRNQTTVCLGPYAGQ